MTLVDQKTQQVETGEDLFGWLWKDKTRVSSGSCPVWIKFLGELTRQLREEWRETGVRCQNISFLDSLYVCFVVLLDWAETTALTSLQHRTETSLTSRQQCCFFSWSSLFEYFKLLAVSYKSLLSWEIHNNIHHHYHDNKKLFLSSFLKTSDKVLCSVTKNKARKNKKIKADKSLKW